MADDLPAIPTRAEFALLKRIERTVQLLLGAAMIVLPLWVSPGGDEVFRTPKLLLLRAVGILLGALMVTAALMTSRESYRSVLPPRKFVTLGRMIVVWTVVATVTSLDVGMSIPSVVTVVAALCLFAAAARFSHWPGAPWIVMAAPAVIAVVAILQMGRWNRPLTRALIGPISDAELFRATPISLLGYRTDVGIYLVVPILCAIAYIFVTRETRMRIGASLMVALLLAGLIVSTTVTAIAALSVALMTMIFIRSVRWGVVASLIIVVVAVSATVAYAPFRQRIVRIQQNVRTGNWDEVITRRLVAFLASKEMILRNPVTGIGPGAFRKAYFDHKIIAARKHTTALPGGGSPDVFQDAHNDHLQIAAETGIVGYALFVMASFAIGRISRTRRDEDPRVEFARLVALPLVISLWILGLAQTPLQIAVTILTYSYVAGLCVGWEAISSPAGYDRAVDAR